MPHAFEEFKDTPLWRVLAATIAELEATREITVATAPEYVIGLLCRELVAGRIVAPTALVDEP